MLRCVRPAAAAALTRPGTAPGFPRPQQPVLQPLRPSQHQSHADQPPDTLCRPRLPPTLLTPNARTQSAAAAGSPALRRLRVGRRRRAEGARRTSTALRQGARVYTAAGRRSPAGHRTTPASPCRPCRSAPVYSLLRRAVLRLHGRHNALNPLHYIRQPPTLCAGLPPPAHPAPTVPQSTVAVGFPTAAKLNAHAPCAHGPAHGPVHGPGPGPGLPAHPGHPSHPDHRSRRC